MWPSETIRLVAQLPQRGIFLTGIDCADPKVTGAQVGRVGEGELRYSSNNAPDFYLNYERRLQQIRDLGLTWLRYAPTYSKVNIAKNEYDFSFTDRVVKQCDTLGITIVADLLHCELPNWLQIEPKQGEYLQNLYFPVQFARYAAAFAKNYPTIKYFTLIHEPFVTAYNSAKLGRCNEQLTGENWQDDRYFVRGASNIAKAMILARKAIEQVWLDEKRAQEPIFVQTESFELAIAAPGSNQEAQAHRFNIRRFVPLDLMFGHRDLAVKAYLIEQGLSEAQYEWFMAHGHTKRTILGVDHYPTGAHEYQANPSLDQDAAKPYRLLELIKEYWERYPLPLLHTEVNGVPKQAVALCQDTYDVLSRLRSEGYPVLGMGWGGDKFPVNLFDKGELLPVGALFADLAAKGLPDFDHQESRFRMKIPL